MDFEGNMIINECIIEYIQHCNIIGYVIMLMLWCI